MTDMRTLHTHRVETGTEQVIVSRSIFQSHDRRLLGLETVTITTHNGYDGPGWRGEPETTVRFHNIREAQQWLSEFDLRADILRANGIRVHSS